MQIGSIEQVLQEKGSLLMITNGNTMWPMLRSRKDPVYLEKNIGAFV
ncbi:MAG TPA: hypothetical protein VFF80_05850 [Bacillota bacterium]|nr:hypothetical protein [Bacillota bacterium]